MIIDIHTHIFPDKIAKSTIELLSGKSHTPPFSDGTADGLAMHAKEAGVDLSIVLPVATSAKQVAKINQSALDARAANLDKGLLSLAAMHPDCDYFEAQMEWIAANGFRGIKIHPVYQGADLDDPRYLAIMRIAAKLNLVVVTHTGLDIGYPGVVHCTPEMAANVMDAVPDVKLVLAHMGGWKEWDRVLKLLPGSGAYLDTSFSIREITPLDDGYHKKEDLPLLPPEMFCEMVNAFGADHILFGTDSPWRDAKAEMDWIRNLPLSEDAVRAILGENAAALLQITI
ncbi:MAG: amidohydrolase family protein [Eubacterium sp.]|nr:amidohydrolase family protein [Eubacterium sp.]